MFVRNTTGNVPGSMLTAALVLLPSLLVPASARSADLQTQQQLDALAQQVMALQKYLIDERADDKDRPG